MTFYSTGELLQEVAQRSRANPSLKALHVFVLWEETIGEIFGKIAREKTKPRSFKEGALTVLAPSSVWLQELAFQSPCLLQILNEKLGKKIVFSLKARLKR